MTNYENIAKMAGKYLEIARSLSTKITISDSLIDDDIDNWEHINKLVEAKTRALDGFARQRRLLPKNYTLIPELNKIYLDITK